MILGKMWMNRHQVILDMATDDVIFVPGRCTHVGSSNNPLPKHTLPLLRRPALPVIPYVIPQKAKKEKVKKKTVHAPTVETVSEVADEPTPMVEPLPKPSETPYIVPQKRQRAPFVPTFKSASHRIEMKEGQRKMNEQLFMVETEAPEVPKVPLEWKAEPDWRLPRNQQRHAPISIAQIGAASFRMLSQDPHTQCFSITYNEIDDVLRERYKEELNAKDALFVGEVSDRDPEQIRQEREQVFKKIPAEYRDFTDVFDPQAARVLPPHRPYDHKIELEGDRPMPKSRLYPMSTYKLQKMKEYLKENLDKGFITPSKAPDASPVLFAAKPNGGLRFCVDYRGLNALTKRDRYPIPLIDETLARIIGCKFITKFDIIAAFNKLRMDPESEDLTTFITSMGAYKYRVLPFGLTNGPASFQHYMNDVLFEYLNDFCQAYLDDIIIYSKTKKEHTRHVRLVLQKLREAGLQVDIDKSEFSVTETTFLDLLVSIDGLRMDPKKIEVNENWAQPTNLKEIQSFIGFCNFFRRVIQGFSRIVKPLTQLSLKDRPFEWTPACQAAFDLLKTTVVKVPVLRHFDRNREAILEIIELRARRCSLSVR